MIFYETFKHKFDAKKMETERLLGRVEELSLMNGSLEDQIHKQKAKNYKLQKRLDDLKEKVAQIQSCQDLSDLESQDNFASLQKSQQDVKVKIKGHYRDPSRASQFSVDDVQSQKNPYETLQAEILENPAIQNTLRNGLNLYLQTKPSLEDEEVFDTQNSYRSHYRFETTEDDMMA